MTIERITPRDYGLLFGQEAVGMHLYNSVPFVEMMAPVTDDGEVRYLVARDSRVRAGIVMGLRDGVMRSPFSAPFGGFVCTKPQGVDAMMRTARALVEYAGDTPMAITLPTQVYIPDMYAATAIALGQAMHAEYADINYHYPLSRATDPEAYMDPTARQKYRAGARAGFRIEVLDATRPEDVARVYEVIRLNREGRGYPLRMSLDQVVRTAPIARSHLLMMSHEGVDVAAALVHTVTPEIAQVVYWGDIPGYAHLRPMNYFAVETVRHFARLGFTHLDIGPSSSDGVPNTGLCTFKESIGCIATLKQHFSC